MAGRSITNFAAALEARAPALAAAQDRQTVDAIVQEAKAEATLREVPNTLVYQIAVAVLGISVLAVIAAQYFITIGGGDIPEGLIAIGATAIGALAGLLAPTPS